MKTVMLGDMLLDRVEYKGMIVMHGMSRQAGQHRAQNMDRPLKRAYKALSAILPCWKCSDGGRTHPHPAGRWHHPLAVRFL